MLLFWSYCSFCRYLSSICARRRKAQSIVRMPFILLAIAERIIGAASTLGPDLSDAPENWPAALPEVSDRLRPAARAPVQCSMVTTASTSAGNNRVDEFHSDSECLLTPRGRRLPQAARAPTRLANIAFGPLASLLRPIAREVVADPGLDGLCRRNIGIAAGLVALPQFGKPTSIERTRQLRV